MTGATMADNLSIHRLRKRYCVLQFQKATIADQQYLLLMELKKMGMKVPNPNNRYTIQHRRRDDGIVCPKCGKRSVDWRSKYRNFKCRGGECHHIFTRREMEKYIKERTKKEGLVT
jgi:hypothetical protein